MKTKLMAMLLMAGGAMFAETHVAIGVQFGGPAYGRVAPAPVVAGAYRPPCPGPGYVWVEGYYDAYGNWYDGYWTLPPYTGAYWVAPRLTGGQFFAGYWGGTRGIVRVEPRREEVRQPAYVGREDHSRDVRSNDTRGNNFQGNSFRGNDTRGNSFQGNSFQGNNLRGNEGRAPQAQARGNSSGRGARR